MLCTALTAVAQKRSNNIVLLMPFCSKQILANPNHSDAQLGNLSREYYQGALIALDSLERSNVPVRFSVFDTENDSTIMMNQLKKTQLKEAELVLGPILQGGNKMMADFVKGKDTYHVSPLMTLSKTKLADPNLISANPDLTNYGKLFYQHIKDQQKDSVNIIVISDKSSLDKTISAALRQVSVQQKNVRIRTVEFKRGMDLMPYLSAKYRNHVVIPSTSENTVNSALKSIKDTSLFGGISVYGFPQWLDFKNPDYLLWQQANVTIASPFFIDYEREDVKAFILAYRERFFTEPSEAAFKGYDQLMFFANALNEDGRKFAKKMEGRPQRMLHTTFDFRQEEKNGYQNMYLNWIAIKELKLVKIN
jgi:hypothetical protein